MNRQQMEKLVDDLNQDEEVENARIVEFLGKPHVYVDLESGDIEVITQDGESRVIPIHTSTREAVTMAGILRTIAVLINANSADSYNNGAEWAETLIEVDADVVHTQVEVMAEQLSDNPRAFYDGFRDVWNSQPGIEPSWWDKLCGRG